MWFKDAGVFDNNDLGDLCRLASTTAAATLATTDVTCVDFQSLQSRREQHQLLRARGGDGNSTPSVLTVTRLRDEVELISSATVHVLFHGGATCVMWRQCNLVCLMFLQVCAHVCAGRVCSCDCWERRGGRRGDVNKWPNGFKDLQGALYVQWVSPVLVDVKQV